MPDISMTHRDALARVVARFRSAAAAGGGEVAHLQELAAILRELRELPLDAKSTSSASAKLMSQPVAQLRLGAAPAGDLDPRVAVILARHAPEFASDENLARLESELRLLVAPLDAAERASDALTAQSDEEESRLAALATLLDVLNAFVTPGEST